MKTPNRSDIHAAFMHGVWLRGETCSGEGLMLAVLTYEVEDLCQKLEALEDLNKRLMHRVWNAKEKSPTNRTRVLASYVGVFEPISGFISEQRFYPDGGSGSEPFTHWMTIPEIEKP